MNVKLVSSSWLGNSGHTSPLHPGFPHITSPSKILTYNLTIQGSHTPPYHPGFSHTTSPSRILTQYLKFQDSYTRPRNLGFPHISSTSRIPTYHTSMTWHKHCSEIETFKLLSNESTCWEQLTQPPIIYPLQCDAPASCPHSTVMTSIHLNVLVTAGWLSCTLFN